MSFAAKFSPKKNEMSIADRVIKDQSVVYGLWGMQPNGERAYFVLLVEKAKHGTFQKILEKGEGCDLQEFGQILYQGWHLPSAEQKKTFREKYGLYEEE